MSRLELDTGPSLSRGRWRLPAGLLGMLLLVGIIEQGSARLGRHCREPGAASWTHAREAVSRSETLESRVVVLGDSLMRHGAIPSIMEAQLGRTTANLAVSGGTTPAHDFLLRRLLARGARPEAIILDAENLAFDPTEHATLYGELGRPADWVELAWHARSLEALSRMALGWGLPTFRARFEFRDHIARALQGLPCHAEFRAVVEGRNRRRNRGAILLPLPSRPADHGGPPHELSGVHPLNPLYLEKVLARAESAGIAVFLVLPPLHPQTQDRRDRGGYSEALDGMVDRLLERHPLTRVVDGRHSRYPPDAFADSVHLAAPGAATFSDDLARQVAEVLDGRSTSRRLVMAPWRPALIDEIEDLALSERLLQRAATRR